MGMTAIKSIIALPSTGSLSVSLSLSLSRPVVGGGSGREVGWSEDIRARCCEPWAAAVAANQRPGFGGRHMGG